MKSNLMSKLYNDNGYVDISYLASRSLPFNILLGGRGTGKTFGILLHYLQRGSRIIYMRRRQSQCDISASETMTPYKSVCDFLDVDYDIPKRQGKIKSIYVADSATPNAYFVALSTFSNMRGFDASDCEAIVYDEFIPEKKEKPFPDEGFALLNAYESVNRNRELQGRPPLTLWLLSNTNDLMSPVLKELNVMSTVLKMDKNKTEQYIDKDRGLQIINCFSSPISAQKSETALYKLAGKDFRDMALNNTFSFDTQYIKARDLRQYRPVVQIGEIIIYEHKSEYLYYATTHKAGNPPYFGTGEKEMARFFKRFGALYDAFILGDVECENLDIYYILESQLKK